MVRTLTAVAVILAIGGAAQAALVTYNLSYNDYGLGPGTDPGKWCVYASANTGDNWGIVAYSFFIQDAVTIANYSPRVIFVDPDGIQDDRHAGFTLLRSGTGATPVTGACNLVNSGGIHIRVEGFGQTSGNLLALNPGGWDEMSKTQTTYGAPLILARGTYTGTLPTFDKAHVDTVCNVYNTSSGTDNIRLPLDLANSTATQLKFIPEPATMGLLGLGGLALLMRRRRS